MSNNPLKKQKKAALKQAELVELSGRSIEAIHQGPLPHPNVLKGYETIVKGSAERILRMAEQQAEHRVSIEKESFNLDAEIRRKLADITMFRQEKIFQLNHLALWLAGVFIFCCFSAAIWSVSYTKNWRFSAIFLSVVIPNLIRIFTKPYDQSKEKQE